MVNDKRSSANQNPQAPQLEAVPAGLIALLLLVATMWDGAFDVRYWAPLALFALVILLAMQAGSGLPIPRSRPVTIALVAIWGYVAWTLLSIIWAESPGRAWEGADRAILYAALVTVALLTLPDRRQARWIGAGLVAGVVAIAAVTLVRLFFDGTDVFLAGRLDDPIGYRNGTAALFAFAAWPLIGVAAPRGGNAALRAAAFAAAVAVLGLAFLTQTRGVVLGVVAGGVVSLLIGPERLRRAWLALAAAAAVAAASGELLTPYHAFSGGDGTVTDSDITSAATALTVLTVAAFALGLFLALLDNGLRTSVATAARMTRFAGYGLAGIATLAAIGALVAIGNPVSYANDKIDEFKEVKSATSGSTRFGSVGGQRYDLWRVAWDEFRDEPLIGVGEGSYSFDYYRERETDRNLTDPHSLPFRLISETGIVGTAVFVAFLVALGVAIARNARGSPDEERRWIAGLAAAGVAVLAQHLTDWLWLIPAVTGLGLFALALAANVEGGETEAEAERPPPTWARVLGSAALLVAAVSVTLVYLSDLYVREARAKIETSPEAQLDSARTAEHLDPLSITPLYLQASAQETLGNRRAAREALEEALDLEPRNFVTLGLLGDLAIRADSPDVAQGYYRRALEENPRDVGLQKLAAGQTD